MDRTTLPKLTDAELGLRMDAPPPVCAAMPVPLKAIEVGQPKFFVNVSVPENDPAASGLNITLKVILRPGHNVNGREGPE